MLNRKGFTLIELMVVILIVAILAAVAIPIMRGRIDAAKWAEGRAAAGTISVALRALAAEGKDPNLVEGNLLALGFQAGDLTGTYFTDACFTGFTVEGSNSWTIPVDATQGTTKQPTSLPTTRTLTVVNGAATWSDD